MQTPDYREWTGPYLLNFLPGPVLRRDVQLIAQVDQVELKIDHLEWAEKAEALYDDSLAHIDGTHESTTAPAYLGRVQQLVQLHTRLPLDVLTQPLDNGVVLTDAHNLLRTLLLGLLCLPLLRHGPSAEILGQLQFKL